MIAGTIWLPAFRIGGIDATVAARAPIVTAIIGDTPIVEIDSIASPQISFVELHRRSIKTITGIILPIEQPGTAAQLGRSIGDAGTGWRPLRPGVFQICSYAGMIWYDVLSQIALTLLYFAFLYYVLGRIFAGKKWQWLVMATILLSGLQFVLALGFGPVLPNVIWLLYAGMAVRLIGLDHPENQAAS